MTEYQHLQQAVQAMQAMPSEQREGVAAELLRALEEIREAQAFDDRFEADVKAGRLDHHSKRIDEHIAAGRITPL